MKNDGSLADLNIDEQFIQTLLGYRTDGRIVSPPAMVVKPVSHPMLPP